MAARAAPAPLVERGHTADLSPPTLDAVRTLLEASFDDWSPHDWDHTLGGMHALAWEDGQVVAHAAVVRRTILVGDDALRCGYVEGVAVLRRRRGRRYGTAVMDAVERLAAAAYPVTALSTAESSRGFYERRGWTCWRGPTSVISPSGLQRTPDDDGGVYVRTALPLDVSGPIACDWRAGDVW